VLLAGALIPHTPALHHNFNAEKAEKPSITLVLPKKEKLSFNYLGSGAFANVVQVEERQFMKIPKSASLEQSLIEEAAILERLHGSDGSSAAQQSHNLFMMTSSAPYRLPFVELSLRLQA